MRNLEKLANRYTERHLGVSKSIGKSGDVKTCVGMTKLEVTTDRNVFIANILMFNRQR